MKIIVPRKQLQAFRSQCRANYPKETMGALYGIRTLDGLEITKIAPVAHTSTVSSINHGPREITLSKMRALRAAQDWLGTIHSHCHSEEYETCEHASKTDIRTALKNGEAIIGIVFVYEGGSKSEVHWTVPKPPPQIEYKEEK